MPKYIVIDARPIARSTGRYVFKLVENLARIDTHNRYTVLVWSDFDQNSLPLPANFSYLIADYPVNGSLKEQLNFYWLLKRLKPDLVHFGMTQQPFLYRGAKVTTIHDLIALRFKNPAANRLVFRVKQSVYGRLVKHAARTSRQLVVPTEYVKQDLCGYTGVKPAKVTVTYEAADPITAATKPLAAVQGKPFILYVGRPQPHKNLWRLIEAFDILKRQHPDLHLVLAGKSDKNYQAIAKKTSTEQIANVIFADFAPDPQLKWLYQNCQAYVFPSLSEGFGLPGLEAMAAGAPVVSSNAACLPEVYGDAARYFDPADAAAMVQAIDDVLRDEALREQLIKAGAAQAKKYSWRRMAEQTLAIYCQALKP